eukprot:6163186-Alexandrium_andersonii.AAC.1
MSGSAVAMAVLANLGAAQLRFRGSGSLAHWVERASSDVDGPAVANRSERQLCMTGDQSIGHCQRCPPSAGLAEMRE